MADEITPVHAPERRPNPEAAPHAPPPGTAASSSADTTALYRRRSSLKMAAELPPGAELDGGPERAITASDIDVAVVMRPGGAAGTPVAAEADEMPSRLPSVSLEIADPGAPPPLVLRHPRARTAASVVMVVLLIAAGWLLRSLF